jgi:hypothetical protein
MLPKQVSEGFLKKRLLSLYQRRDELDRLIQLLERRRDREILGRKVVCLPGPVGKHLL